MREESRLLQKHCISKLISKYSTVHLCRFEDRSRQDPRSGRRVVLKNEKRYQEGDPGPLRRHSESGVRVLEACKRPRLVLVGDCYLASRPGGSAEYPKQKITQGEAQSHRENTELREEQRGLPVIMKKDTTMTSDMIHCVLTLITLILSQETSQVSSGRY